MPAERGRVLQVIGPTLTSERGRRGEGGQTPDGGHDGQAAHVACVESISGELTRQLRRRGSLNDLQADFYVAASVGRQPE